MGVGRMRRLDIWMDSRTKGLSGNMFSSFKGGQTGRLMVFSGQNWYQRMHFLYAEALVKATCLIIPIFID